MSKTHGVTIESSNPPISDTNPESRYVKDLDGRCAYFPLSDYHNILIFKTFHKIKDDSILKEELEKRLFLALLLFDKVILHCTDPLRNQAVFAILEDNNSFVDDGSILFVFSNSINTVHDDYKKYIDDRIIEYQKNEFSGTDIDSLRQRHMSDDYYEKVIQLLKKSKYLLKKGQSGNIGFKELIQEDLSTTIDTIVMNSENFGKSQVRFLNLTIYQFLTIKYLDGNEIFPLFEPELTRSFIAKWEEENDRGDRFSRHTFIEELKDLFLKNQSSEQARNRKRIISAIETRLSLLYSKLNCAFFPIIEFHPAIEKRGIYSCDLFKKFIESIAGKPIKLSKEKVVQIRKNDEWLSFRDSFLACMATLQAQTSTACPSELRNHEPSNKMFHEIIQQHDIKQEQAFQSIRKIILDN